MDPPLQEVDTEQINFLFLFKDLFHQIEVMFIPIQLSQIPTIGHMTETPIYDEI